MHIFDHTVKPVLLYASEIVGLFNNNKNVGVNSNNDSHFISNLYRYKSTGLTVWSNICIQFGAEQGILLNIFFNLKKAF
jgi:hypothetical protein